MVTLFIDLNRSYFTGKLILGTVANPTEGHWILISILLWTAYAGTNFQSPFLIFSRNSILEDSIRCINLWNSTKCSNDFAWSNWNSEQVSNSVKKPTLNNHYSANQVISAMRAQRFRILPAFLFLIPLGITLIGWSLIALVSNDLQTHPKLFIGSVGLLWANLTVIISFFNQIYY